MLAIGASRIEEQMQVNFEVVIAYLAKNLFCIGSILKLKMLSL